VALQVNFTRYPDMTEETKSGEETKFDDLIGKHVLVGLTYENPDGSEGERQQFHGTVVSASAAAGIRLALNGESEGQQYTLPPDLRAFSLASPGKYRLRATGEIVSNPDYLASWRLSPPEPESAP
jgi:hypothetical protein